MKRIVELQKKIVPDILTIMEKRYLVLREISLNEPVGRRILSTKLGLSERIVRSEVEFLKENGFINANSAGMTMTQCGVNILEDLKDFIAEIRGIAEIEEKIKKKLGIRKVIMVPGNSDEDDSILKDMGKAASKYFLKVIQSGMKLGVTGGNTMFHFASYLEEIKKYEDIIVVPARGGLGEKLEIQANNVAAIVGKKIGGSYRMLHVPDSMNKATRDSLINEPDIRRTLEYVDNLDMIVFGIGRADDMARRRKMDEKEVNFIESKSAVSEAFGYFFNRNGQIVHEASTIGINLEKYKSIENVIGIAGGERKAQAIIAISKINKNLTLVIDEGSGNKILELLSED